jgi:hypothetical protein
MIALLFGGPADGERHTVEGTMLMVSEHEPIPLRPSEQPTYALVRIVRHLYRYDPQRSTRHQAVFTYQGGG